MADVCVSQLVENVAIFMLFELRTPSTRMPAQCYWLKFVGTEP